MRQVALLGENLSLRRRIELRAGRPEIIITDRISNDGFVATPHMLLYHINVGWPLLDEWEKDVIEGRMPGLGGDVPAWYRRR